MTAHPDHPHAGHPQPGRRCPGIVPPVLLRAVVEHGSPEQRERALRTLALDAALRDARRAAPLPRIPPGVAGQGAPPGPQRTVSDARGTRVLPGRTVRAEGQPPTGDLAADEAYDGLGATYDLWAQAYGRDSLDGAGLPLLAVVHYGRDYDNAFWDGRLLVFGDGDGELFGCFTASLDVIGHEIAHGVTETEAGLVYEGQSGALNEHVSDVFGSLVRQHLLGQTAAEADWLVGADLLRPGVDGVALRSMAAPGTAYDDDVLGKDPQPASMSGFVVTEDDNGGVHINSGIPNRAFHLAATALGGHAWEVAGQIWYDVLRSPDLAPDADFPTFAALTVDAAGRFDAAQQVRTAWHAVEVEPAT